MRFCNRCKTNSEFYKSVNHMCKNCWSDYQRIRREDKLKNIPMGPQGRPVIEQLDREIDFFLVSSRWLTKEIAGLYLAGIIDGEGHIQYYQYGGKSIQIANTDIDIIRAACEALSTLNVSYKVRKDKRYSKKKDKRYKDCFTIFIYRQENFRILQKYVPLCCKYKKDKLDNMIDSYKIKRPEKSRPSSYEVATKVAIRGDALICP